MGRGATPLAAVLFQRRVVLLLSSWQLSTVDPSLILVGPWQLRTVDPSLIPVFLLVCGVIAAAIGHSKNRGILGSFLLGALLGVIGVVVVAVLPSGVPKAPPGMRVVRCQTCNAVQNIPDADTTFECWQCKNVSKAPDTRRHGPEDMREWLNRVRKQP